MVLLLCGAFYLILHLQNCFSNADLRLVSFKYFALHAIHFLIWMILINLNFEKSFLFFKLKYISDTHIAQPFSTNHSDSDPDTDMADLELPKTEQNTFQPEDENSLLRGTFLLDSCHDAVCVTN